MSLDGACEGILHQFQDIFPRQRLCFPWLQVMACSTSRYVLILEVDLIIQKWHNQASSGSSRAALFPLIAADGIIAVQGALSLLVESTQDCVYIVREEAL